MRIQDGGRGVSRRDVLRGGGTSLIAMTITAGGVVIGGGGAWAASGKALSGEAIATLIQMSRDLYPHDKIADKYYAAVVMQHDEAAAASADDKKALEEGVSGLDAAAQAAHGAPYASVGWESQRAAILRSIESTPFLQRVRGALVTGLYNNQELWPMFGYEGESASQGGYLERGFDDIAWLDAV